MNPFPKTTASDSVNEIATASNYATPTRGREVEVSTLGYAQGAARRKPVRDGLVQLPSLSVGCGTMNRTALFAHCVPYDLTDTGKDGAGSDGLLVSG